MFETGIYKGSLKLSRPQLLQHQGLLSLVSSCGETLPVLDSFPSNPNTSAFMAIPSMKVKVSVFFFSVKTILKVLLSDWLLVEPLILLFTMTFMNTVTKSVLRQFL